MFSDFTDQLYNNIIADNRWKMYLEGLGNTLIMALGALVVGIVIGCLIAVCKVTYANRKATQISRGPSFKNFLWKALNIICDIYLTVVRGMPVVVLLMVFSTIVFKLVPLDQQLFVAIIAFGVNSGAYVAEIIRAGIMAVDGGQMEAGRSLGLKSGTTMQMIILPQAIKNILPALGNEAITLMKETSVAGYVAIVDLTYQSTLIRSRTFSSVPLIVIAIIYILLVTLFSFLVRKLERRLAKSENR